MTAKKIVIVLLCVFLLAGAVFFGVLTLNNLKVNQVAVNPPVQDNFPTVPTTTGNDKPMDTTTARVITNADIAWLAAPVKLGNLKLVDYVSAQDSSVVSASEYYKVATVKNGGEIIDEFIQPNNPGGKLIMRFQKTPAGKYFLLSKNSEFDANEFVNNAATDPATNLSSLVAPKKLILSGITFTKKEWSDKMPLVWEKLEKIGRTSSGDFFKELTPTEHNLAYAQYVLKLPDSTAMYYDMTLSFLADDNSLMATFNSESQDFKAKRFSILMAKGCSTLSAVIAVSDLTGRLTSIGTTKSGDVLYLPKDVNDELYKAVFQDYKIGRTGTTTYDGQPILTYEELVAKKPVVVWSDALGDYHVFYDNNYGHLAECGKPVIYLYPEVKTEVKVGVGAEVRISEPNYGAGWRVTAFPSGKIINSDGAVYENLYWEGLGRGNYPAITSGRVVKGENIEAELLHDLAAFGLNKNETKDFMEFWLPKMPKSPYIRLTWLDTAEMNELAPLYISPRPETVARVFLDFSGQDTAETNLALQELKGFERKGFTVVEWGGLLIGGK